MSRLFNDAASEFLEVARSPILGYPLALLCWAYTDTDTIGEVLMQVQDSASATEFHRLAMMGNIGGNPIRAQSRSLGADNADTTIGFSVDEWTHAAGIFESATSRAALINGGHKGTNADVSNDTGFDSVSIGRAGDLTPGAYFSGMIAEAVVLKVSPTDHQAFQHAQGKPAPFIWSRNEIAAYWPLVSAEDFDWYRRYDMVAFNTPGIAPHPPKVLEFWRRYQMRAVTTQGISRLVSWGVANEWNLRIGSLARIPRYGFTNFQVPGIV